MSNKPPATTQQPDGKPALTPKLRFPEFRDAAGWEEQTLSFACQMQAGKFVSASEIKEQNAQGLYPCFGGNGLRGYTATFTHSGKYSLIGRQGALCGNVKIGFGQFHATEHAVVVTPKNGIKGDWLFYLLDLLNLNRFATGQAQPGLSVDVLQKLPIAIPNQEPEQQKIAECLSSVDELIAAQARKLDALKTHKKGLMQQLFPREGETQPRLRFPEFQNAGEWVVKKLEDIGRVIRGASPRPKGDPRYYGGPVPRLMVQDVTRDGKWVTPQIDSLTEDGARLSRPCPAGTLTIVCSGSVGVVSFLAVDACIHDGFLALVDIDESIATKDFLFHTLSTLREQFEKGATHGGVFTNLTTTGIDLFEIKRPGIPEQQRIASCLTSLDDLITAHTQKHAALKTHKRGLMQQLFPSPEEVEA